jgi:hypothetical protein
MRPRIWFFVLCLALAACFPNASLADGKGGCPVTNAPDPPFVQPPPFNDETLGSGEFFYGTSALWAMVHPHWRVHGGGKLPYFRQGYDWLQEKDPRLTVVARRLDSPEKMVWAGWANNGNVANKKSFMVTGLSIPTAGCWEIAAHYSPAPDNIQTLTYTVWVEP